MFRKGYNCGDSIEEVCEYLHIDKSIGHRIVYDMRMEGYSEKAVCHIASKCENKLIKFVGDTRFVNIYKNEIRKYAKKIGEWKP